MRSSRSTSRITTKRPGAFTLIELLVVIVIIGLLATLIVVAVASAIARGRDAGTEQFLRSVAFSAEQFEADFGYHPPLMHDAIDNSLPGLLTEAHRQDAVRLLEEQRFNSIFTLPVYLVGVGRLHPDGADLSNPDDDGDDMPDRHDGVAGPGFRDPGADRAWGGAANRQALRPTLRGRVYGPYMDVSSGDNMRLVEEDDLIDHPHITFEEVRGRYVFVDRWDRPIRYYRQLPTRDRREQPPVISLKRVPIELIRPELVEGVSATLGLDAAQERDLLNAPFALLSAGRDEIYADAEFATERIDPDFDNAALLLELLNDDDLSKWTNLVESVRNNVRVTP
ncbi:MAG: type II secretion system protein [Phycisphaeraceae bacterium]|nr:MAG: type II secretion system protein [Phycisphaeraceae bacterium]